MSIVSQIATVSLANSEAIGRVKEFVARLPILDAQPQRRCVLGKLKAARASERVVHQERIGGRHPDRLGFSASQFPKFVYCIPW